MLMYKSSFSDEIKSGFIDLNTGEFHRNGEVLQKCGHPDNAHYLIDANPKLADLYKQETQYKDREDFLIFRANFAKVGSCGKKNIIIKSTSMFKKKLKYCMKKYGLMDYEILEWTH